MQHLFDLSPSNFNSIACEHGGLSRVICAFIARASQDSPAEVSCDVVGTAYPLAAAVETELLAIAREAVVRSIYEALPTRVAVELSYDADAVRLSISDNGRDISVHDEPDESGLLTIRQRADRIGADVCRTHNPGSGTELVITVPRDVAEIIDIRGVDLFDYPGAGAMH